MAAVLRTGQLERRRTVNCGADVGQIQLTRALVDIQPFLVDEIIFRSFDWDGYDRRLPDNSFANEPRRVGDTPLRRILGAPSVGLALGLHWILRGSHLELAAVHRDGE